MGWSYTTTARWLVTLLIALLLSGCFAWQYEREPWPSTKVFDDALSLKRQAEEQFTIADSRKKLVEVIRLQEQYLASDPMDGEVLTMLANQYILLGAAYARNGGEREESYLRAMQLAARACDQHAGFSRRIDAGEPFWEASSSLDQDYLDAMGFWVTALFYWYKDCQGAVGQAINFHWIKRARQVMEQMTALDPGWGEGMLSFLWGVYYLSIPEPVGGDRERSAAYFQQAIDQGPAWLQHRWGRGRYYHTKMGNMELSRRDLEWVVEQDVSESAGPYAWSVYIQRDARQILAERDR